MLKQVTSQIIISFDDTIAGTNYRFLSDNLAEAETKAQRLLATTPSGNVVIKRLADDSILSYFEN